MEKQIADLKQKVNFSHNTRISQNDQKVFEDLVDRIELLSQDIVQMNKRIAETGKVIKEMRIENAQYHNDLLVKVGESGNLMKEAILNLTEKQAKLVEIVWQSINSSEIDKNQEEKQKADELLQLIVSKLDKLELANKKEIDERLKGEVSTGGKLKLIIPIIPKILQYEQEFGFAAKEPVKSWKDLWHVFVKRKKVN